MKIDLSGSEKPVNKKSEIKNFILCNEAIFLIICTFVAFLIRFLLIPDETSLHSDSVYYLTLGRKMISGDLWNGISAYWAPFYPFLIGVFSLFFQDLEFAGRFVSVIAGTALIFPTYFLIRDIYGRSVAFIGIILVTFHPSLIQSSGWALAESLYTLIFTAGIMMGWYSLRKGKKQNFFLTGLLFGAAYLTKPEAIGFIALLFFLTAGTKFFCRNLNFRFLVTRYLFLLLGFAILFLPYVIFIHQKVGHWTISQKLQNNITSVEYEKSLLELTDDGETTKKDQLMGDVYEIKNQQTKNPLSSDLAGLHDAKLNYNENEFIPKTYRNLKKEVKEYIPEILPFTLILLVIIGLFHKPWTRLRLAREVYLFSFLICTLLGYAVSVINLRYCFAVIPVLICWSSNGIVMFSDWASKSASNFRIPHLKINSVTVQVFTLLTAVALLMFSLFNEIRTDINSLPDLEEKKAGLWIKNHKNSSSLIMDSEPAVAFYAEEKHIFLPDEDFLKVLDYAKRQKVTYLVIAQRNLKNYRKFVIPNEHNFPQDLKLVYENEHELGHKTFVYQLRD
ncbi:MAG: glycosyltransferase family 39 protein [Acidobacteriota bacterium]|nr:glycosyltransferase family 39 protein [Acidobacteriota bacterium]